MIAEELTVGREGSTLYRKYEAKIHGFSRERRSSITVLDPIVTYGMKQPSESISLPKYLTEGLLIDRFSRSTVAATP